MPRPTILPKATANPLTAWSRIYIGAASVRERLPIGTKSRGHRTRLFRIALFATVTVFAQSDNTQFNAVSVKHANPKQIGGTWKGGPGTTDPGQFTAGNTTMTSLAMRAYDVKYAYEMEWKSGWMATDFYDIVANVPAGATAEQFRTMLQRMLAERFGLVVHRETRQLPGYRMVVAEGGPKLKPAAPPVARAGDEPDVIVKHGTPQLSDTAGSGTFFTLAGAVLRGRHENMKGLAIWLTRQLGAPVIDATGIEGEYDYDLSFKPEPVDRSRSTIVSPPPVVDAAAPTVAPDPDGRPTLRNAVRDLGLKLDTVKAIPVDVLVLDKANREPTVN